MRSKSTIAFATAVLLGWTSASFAIERRVHRCQEPEEQQKQETGENAPDSSSQHEGESRPSGPPIGDAFYDLKNRLGLSLGIHEGFADNIFRSSIGGESVWGTSLLPRIFLNMAQQRSRLHLDYGVACTVHKSNGRLNTAAHFGNLTYTYEAPQRASVLIEDRISSGTDDLPRFGGPLLYPTQSLPGSWIELLYGRQRVTSNSLTSVVNLSVTGKGHLNIVATYHIYRWQLQENRKTDGVQYGAEYRHDWKRRLSLSTGYSAYYNNLGPGFHNIRIQRFQVGGFKLRLSPSWQAFASGGFEVTDYLDDDHFDGSIYAGISRALGSNLFSVSYQRASTSSIGLAGIYASHILAANVGQRLNSWMSVQLCGQYSRNASHLRSGYYGTIQGQAAVEFAVRPTVIGSVSYSYWDQYRRDLAAPVRDATRWSVRAGLDYIWRR